MGAGVVSGFGVGVATASGVGSGVEAGSAAGEEGAGLSAGGALSPPHPARQLRTMTTVRKSAIVLSFMMFPPI